MREQVEQWIAWHLPEAIARWCWVRVEGSALQPSFRRQSRQDSFLALPGIIAPPERERVQGARTAAAD
jgi:hypothetical protein